MSKDFISSPLFIKYLRAYENNPRSIVFAPLAEVYRKEGKTKKAIEILKEGLKYNPSYVTGYLSLASCYADLSQYNLAYSLLKSLIETNRDNIRLQKLFAQVCLKIGQDDEALEAYKYLLFLGPKDQEIAAFVKKLEDREEEMSADFLPPLPFESEVDQFRIENLSLSSHEDTDIHVDGWEEVDFSRNMASRRDMIKFKSLKKTMWAFYEILKNKAENRNNEKNG